MDASSFPFAVSERERPRETARGKENGEKDWVE